MCFRKSSQSTDRRNLLVRVDFISTYFAGRFDSIKYYFHVLHTCPSAPCYIYATFFKTKRNIMKPTQAFLLKGLLLAAVFLFMLLPNVHAIDTPVPTPTANPDLIPSCGIDIIFVMDESGSIAGSGDATNVIPQARNGANELLTALVGTNSRVAIVEFNLHARRAVIGGTTAYQYVDANTLPDFVDYLYANNGGSDAANYDPANAGNEGWTNWEAALNQVEDILANDMYAPLVLFFTDGKPTAYYTSGTNTQSGASAEAQALVDAIGAANAVKALGTHLFIVGLPNPDLPEGNCQAVTGPDRYLDLQPDFTKGDYTISSSQTLEDDLRAIAGLVCRADLRLSKSVYPVLVCAGSTVEFTITVTNDGLEDATGVQAKDYLPSGYTYVSDDGGSATTESGGIITWDIGNLENGHWATLKITATVNGSGDYKNVAEVTSSDLPDYDSTPNNDNGDQSEDDEDAASVRFIQCDDQNPCTIDDCSNGECTFIPGQLDINVSKTDMSCRCAASQDQLCQLDFAGLPHGEPVGEQYADYGIHIFAKPDQPNPITRPVVFDTYVNGTDDADLEVNIGNILIIPLVQNSSDPDDDPDGGEITMNFDNARTVLSFDFVDQDEPGCNCAVYAYDGANNLIKTVAIPFSGNATVQTIQVNASGVRQLVFRFNDSGGIGNIRFLCDEPCCDGTATANTSGGTSQTKYYTWSNGQQTIGNSQTITGLCPGTYYVTVEDGNGCSATSSVTINNPDEYACDNCQFDCAFECNGSAYLDGCGVCVGGNTGNQPCGCYLQVTSATLMYEGIYGEIGPLTNGTVINRDVHCRVNVRANLCQSPVGSVKFVLNGSTTKIENTAPYAFWGDNNGSYKIWTPQGGNHTLVITAYSGANATGTAGVPLVINFSVTGSSNSYACNNPPSICIGGCNDYNPCTDDACVNSNCVFTQKNCDDGDACTADACYGGICTHTPVSSQPSYLKVVSPSKSWRKLKLGYSANSVYTPKQNVIAGGNNQLCITLRAVGTPEWNKIQVRPQGSSSAVVLGNYISGSQPNWTTICIPLSAFGSFNFSQIAYMELPYSSGANAFEIHLQKVEFSGGSSPFLWFGDPKTNNKYEATSGLNVSLVAGQLCNNYNKKDGSELANSVLNNSEENYLNAFPNPFKQQVNIEFSVATDERVRVEIAAVDGRIIETLFEGNANAGEVRRLEFNAGTLADGMYFYRLITESGVVENRKLLLAR